MNPLHPRFANVPGLRPFTFADGLRPWTGFFMEPEGCFMLFMVF